MTYLNFILVYILGGFVISNLISRRLKKTLGRDLILVLGYGISPYFISITLLCLYLLFPSKNWSFYNQLVYLAFLALAILSVNKDISSCYCSIKKIIINFYKHITRLKALSKSLMIYVLLIISFIFIRGFVFPTTSGDAIKYLRQGRAVAEYRNLQSYYTSQHLLNNVDYEFNQGIRPGLPILYSFFYGDTTSPIINEFSSRFIYFYYFILLLVLFAIIIHSVIQNRDFVVYGLTILVSSFSFVRFLIRPNYINTSNPATCQLPY